MIELQKWIQSKPFADKPWLMLGKGPTFACHRDIDLNAYNLIGLNHVVRELKLNVAHAIDMDVIQACADKIPANCDWLLMPRRPHVNFVAGPKLLEEYFESSPVLREMDARGRLVWYKLNSEWLPQDEPSPLIVAKTFSSVAVLQLLAHLGAKKVQSLGIDGGQGYSKAFKDLEGTTMLAGGQGSFDRQFEDMAEVQRQTGIDYEPLVETMRVYLGTDESQLVAAHVLAHSIRKHASRPVEVVPMLNLPTPVPKDPKNRGGTNFSFARFHIPKLAGFRGRALYLDSDMQVFADLAELWQIPFGQHKVLCTYHAQPPLWLGKEKIKSGRHTAVMLLDCSRLDWDVEKIIAGLDEERYTYSQLMSDMCILRPEEIGDTLPPEWNSLETYEPGKTKLLHYTVVPTQPWKNDQNPLGHIWEACYEEAVAAGAVPFELVSDAVSKGLVKPSLTAAFTKASAATANSTNGTDSSRQVELLRLQLSSLAASTAETRGALQAAFNEVYSLRQELERVRNSWTWKIGKTVLSPFSALKRILR